MIITAPLSAQNSRSDTTEHKCWPTRQSPALLPKHIWTSIITSITGPSPAASSRGASPRASRLYTAMQHRRRERERAHHSTRRAAYKHTRAHFWCSSYDPCRFTILTAVCNHQEKPGNPSRWPTGQHNIWAKNRPCSQYESNTPANASAPDSNISKHAFPSCTLLSSFICVFS